MGTFWEQRLCGAYVHGASPDPLLTSANPFQIVKWQSDYNFMVNELLTLRPQLEVEESWAMVRVRSAYS